MKKRSILFHFIIGAAGVLLLASEGLAEPYVVTVRNEKIVGSRIRAKSDGTVVLTVQGGTREFTTREYKAAFADKPTAYDTAVNLLAQGKADQAIPILKKVMSEYKFLGWDIRAAVYLGQAQAEIGDAPAAILTFEKLFKDQPALKGNETVKLSYWKALAAGGRSSTLEPELDKVISGSDREAAARAQLLRGDLKTAKNKVEAALLDYLRTAVLYKQQKSVQPEALYKTGLSLEKLRDPRAKKFFKQVVDEYAGTNYANMAQEKL